MHNRSSSMYKNFMYLIVDIAGGEVAHTDSIHLIVFGVAIFKRVNYVGIIYDMLLINP